jgi:hypothetical protein
MYIRWTNFKCPFCSATWACRIVSAPRPDKEFRTCSTCNREFKTHDIEWAHMARKQRIGYVLNEWTVAWLFLYAMVVFAMVGIGSDHATTLADYLVEAAIIVGVAGVMFGPILVVKWLTIRRSNQRILAADATAAHIPGTLAGGPSGIVSH